MNQNSDALCLFFLPNFPGPTFISCLTSIPGSRVKPGQGAEVLLYYSKDPIIQTSCLST